MRKLIFLLIWGLWFLRCNSFEIYDLKIYSTSSSIKIEWKTTEFADSRVYYSPSNSLLNSIYCAFIRESDYKKEHSIEIPYLCSNFKIYLIVESVNKEGKAAKSRVIEAKTENYLRNFLIIGPFKGNLKQDFIDEKKVLPSINKEIKGKRWFFTGAISDRLDFKNLEEGIYYLSLWIFSELNDKNSIYLETDTEYKVFLNGREINGREGNFELNLNEGWNLLLIKILIKKNNFISVKYDRDFKKISFIEPLPKLETELIEIDKEKVLLKYKFFHPYTEPKIIQSGWGGISVSQLKDNLEIFERKYWYFDGITIRFDKVDDIVPYGGFWPFSYSVNIDYEKLKPQIEIIKNLNFKRWKSNFLWVSAYLRGEDNVDWLFNEDIWKKIKDNFKVIGKIVRETGCKGIFLDCETPGKKTQIFNYMGYYKENYKFTDCAKRAFERGKEIIEVLQEECPDIVIISVDGSRMVGLGRSLFQYHWGNLEKSSVFPGIFYPEMKARLFYSFLTGMIEGAKGNTRIIDGEYSPHIGGTLDGPYKNTKFFIEVLPYFDDFDIKVSPDKLFLHSQIGGRANTYESPGRENPDAGMYEKLVPLLRDSYCDYIWTYHQSYTPGFGWYEYFWMDKKKREEMEEKIKKGEVKPFVPNLIDGKPEEFFKSIEKAKKEFLPKVFIEKNGEKIELPEEGEIILKKGEIIKLIGESKSGRIEKIIGR